MAEEPPTTALSQSYASLADEVIRDDLGGAWDYGEGAVLGWALALESLIEDDSSLCLFCVTDDLAAPNPADIYQELDAQAIDQLMQNDPDLAGQTEQESEDQGWWDWAWEKFSNSKFGRVVTGTVCGAVAGALTGAGVGALAGTFIFPGVGTAGGAGAGAMWGAINGAISGFAAGCQATNLKEAAIGGGIGGGVSGILSGFLGPLGKANPGVSLFSISLPTMQNGAIGLVAIATVTVPVAAGVTGVTAGALIGTGAGAITVYMNKTPSDATPSETPKVKFTKEMNANSRKIAEGTKIRKIKELVDKFGGTERGWVKKKGWDALGREWHWYEHHGIGRVGLKPAGTPDPF